MLNYIWLGLMLIAIVTGFANGKLPEVTKAAFEMAETAVKIAFGLIGVMAFSMATNLPVMMCFDACDIPTDW